MGLDMPQPAAPLRLRTCLIAAAVAAVTFAGTPAAAEFGVLNDRIVLGQSAAFKGPAASLGINFRAGLLAAMHEANRAGGVHGRRITLTSYNDGYEPEQAIANTIRLIDDDQVFALVGEVGVPTSRSAQPIAEKGGVPFIGPFTGAAFLRDEALTTVVNVRASYEQEAEALVSYLIDHLGLSRIAVLYQDDTFGRSGLAGTTEALRKRGLEIAVDATYMRNTTAVKRAFLAIRSADPDAVIIVGAYKPAAIFIKIASNLGLDVVYASLSFVGGEGLAAELGRTDETVIVSQVVPLFDDLSQPLVARFQNALRASAPEADAGFVALEGYLTGRLVIEALELLGPDPTRSALLDLFARPLTIDVDGMELTFGDGDNQGSDAVFLTTFGADGRFITVDE